MDGWGTLVHGAPGLGRWGRQEAELMLERWARPLSGLWNGIAEVTRAFYRVLGGVGRLLQDSLNGTWLGHTVHGVLTDVVVGGTTMALFLDVLRVFFGVDGLADATTWVLGLSVLAALGAIITGLTDFKDTSPGDARNVAGLHGVTNIIAVIVFAVSLFMRLGGSHDAGFWTLLIGYLVVSTGAYIGGHVVFRHGYMVNYNALQKGRRAEDYTPPMAGAPLAANTP